VGVLRSEVPATAGTEAERIEAEQAYGEAA
jgi:hypothetical protein